MHPNQIQDWKKKLVAEAEHVFGAGAIEAAHSERETQQLHAKIRLRKGLNVPRA